MSVTQYPDKAVERDRWILDRRPSRPRHNVWEPQGAFREREPDGTGGVAEVATLLLTGRECPWRCLMCDLWRHTVEEEVPAGAIPRQVALGLERLRGAAPAATEAGVGSGLPRWLKLYNSGSWFDPRSVPPADDAEVAKLARGFERVIVESHPALIGARARTFRDRLRAAADGGGGRLEVAMGLETAHPGVLERLNKRVTLEQFRAAAARLVDADIAVRAFVLVQPPFLGVDEAYGWACRSIDFAFDCGVGVVALIPTRFGNGALEALARVGQFQPPGLALLEACLIYGLRLGRGRVLADVWDADRFQAGEAGTAETVRRLERMNLRQRVEEATEG